MIRKSVEHFVVSLLVSDWECVEVLCYLKLATSLHCPIYKSAFTAWYIWQSHSCVNSGLQTKKYYCMEK